MVARRMNKKPTDIRLNEILNFIKLDWKKDKTNIYGEVNKIEFHVKESEANKMIKWWEERYKHLKIFSALPWTGKQCTTTVKMAIQEAFPFSLTRGNNIPDTTQTPKGLLQDLRVFISTSKEHYGQLSKMTVIKPESIDFKG